MRAQLFIALLGGVLAAAAPAGVASCTDGRCQQGEDARAAAGTLAVHEEATLALRVAELEKQVSALNAAVDARCACGRGAESAAREAAELRKAQHLERQLYGACGRPTAPAGPAPCARRAAHLRVRGRRGRRAGGARASRRDGRSQPV